MSISNETEGRRTFLPIYDFKPLFTSFSSNVLLVKPGEGRRTALLFLHLFLASAVFVMGRTVRDTLFLSRYSLSALPWMFVCYGVASALTVVIYAQVADRLPRDKMIAVWAGLGVATYLATWGVVRGGAFWIYPVFYVWSEVFANLLVSQFWTLANDLHDTRSAKRLFGTIGSARVLGVIAVGASAGAVVKVIGTVQLLFVLAGMLLVIARIALVLGREKRAGKAPPARAADKRQHKVEGERIVGDPYVNVLSLMLLLAFMALTLGDYQFKAIARATYREDDLARFFSFFYAVTGIVSFVFQVLVTPRLLARFGVGAGASVMPSVFGAASAVLLFVPILPVVTIMKFADNGFQYTIHETTLQALYVPFASRVKVRTRAFLDAVVKPLAYGAGGGLLIVLAGRMPVERLSMLSVGLVVLWLCVVPLVRRRYLAKLAATLTARGAVTLEGEERLDAAGRRILYNALSSDDPRIVLGALGELPSDRSSEVSAALLRLVSNKEPEIRIAALARLREHPDTSPEVAASALADPLPEVRAAAVAAYATAAGDAAIAALLPLLDDPADEVRAAAIAALLARGGFEGNLLAGARLKSLLDSPAARDRAQAARVLGEVGQGVVRLLTSLLRDVDPEVRRAALRAAAAVADARLVEPLAKMLGDPACRDDAATALAAIGAPALTALASLLADRETPRPVRLLVPRIMRRIDSPASYEALRPHLGMPDSRLRLRIASALGSLRGSLGLSAEPLSALRALVETEIGETSVNLAAWQSARERYPSDLFDEESRYRYRGCVQRILRLLELRYDAPPLRLVRERITDPERRANALEVLDTALEPQLRGIIMPFLDEHEAVDRAASTTFGRQVPGAEAYLEAECRHPNPYVALLAFAAISRQRGVQAADLAAAMLSHSEPLVREGALCALCAVAPDRARCDIAGLAEDPDPAIAHLARHSLALLQGELDPETKMYTTIEKILLLRRVPLFAELNGDDLAPLARVAAIETLETGSEAFREGDLGDALFIIVRGAVEIRRGTDVIARLGAPEVFGEMAVLDASPRSATAVAVEPTELLRIGSEEFYEALHERSELAEGVIKMLSRRLREANAHLSQGG